MPGESPEYEYIDYTAIRFPSDQLSIGTMRRVHPDVFDVERPEFARAMQDPPGFFDPEQPRIHAMLLLERLLAQNAYEEVRWVFTEHNYISNEDKPGYVEELTDCYVRYGLASGPQHAQQLIRDFEAQAAGQAQSGKRGRGRP